jgi:hypothetical protein
MRCPGCDGSGYYTRSYVDGEELVEYDVTCPDCSGTGEIEPERDLESWLAVIPCSESEAEFWYAGFDGVVYLKRRGAP